MVRKILFFIIVVIILGGVFYFSSEKGTQSRQFLTDKPHLQNMENAFQNDLDPLSIENLRNGEYPGSDIVIEEKLESGANYDRYITSYKSEGLKIYALLTIPIGEKPKNGWPVIIFNHGFIPPEEYRTTERYIAYVDGFARSGYIVFRPDYRGHGNSEGEPTGAYGSNGYTIDVLNAVSSMKRYKNADPKKIGMWGHSLGGFITLRNMVVLKDIKAGVIWAGVVASYQDLLERWRRSNFTPPPSLTGARRWRQVLVEKYGTPQANPEFWNSISANSYLRDISGPLQLHHGTADSSVPVEFSETLANQLKKVGKKVELYTYPGDDHNITNNFNGAMQKSIEFFNKYL
jgi:dipeptidyl aminopeptidase/acylaminoacyl peptidase